MAEARVCLGVVTGAHGTMGEVNVHSFAAAPDAIAAYGAVTDEGGRTLRVTGLRQGPKGPIARFAEIDDRSGAEALKGTGLFVRRDQLPDLAQEEYYHGDLVGLRVEDKAGTKVGTVTAVHNYGAGDLIEVDRGGRPSVLLPFTREAVPAIDISGGFLTVDLPAGSVDDGGEPAGNRPAPGSEGSGES